jgi:hypothetical protein
LRLGGREPMIGRPGNRVYAGVSGCGARPAVRVLADGLAALIPSGRPAASGRGAGPRGQRDQSRRRPRRQAAGARLSGDPALPASWPAHAACLRRAGCQAPRLPVALRVEHVGEQLAGRGYLGDVACLGAAAGDDSVLGLADTVPAGTCCTASMSAHRNSREPCLVMRPRTTLASDSQCRGVRPAHEHSRVGWWNRMMSPDLGHDDSGEHPADAGQASADRTSASAIPAVTRQARPTCRRPSHGSTANTPAFSVRPAPRSLIARAPTSRRRAARPGSRADRSTSPGLRPGRGGRCPFPACRRCSRSAPQGGFTLAARASVIRR